jgi:hypothetical protein
MTAPPFTTLLRGVYQIIQTNAQGRDSRLFVQTCMFRSALPGWGTPKTRSRFGIRGAAQILWEFDRAISIATSAKVVMTCFRMKFLQRLC